jgi:hypothetical protein
LFALLDQVQNHCVLTTLQTEEDMATTLSMPLQNIQFQPATVCAQNRSLISPIVRRALSGPSGTKRI